jgi:hypothetical protein
MFSASVARTGMARRARQGHAAMLPTSTASGASRGAMCGIPGFPGRP